MRTSDIRPFPTFRRSWNWPERRKQKACSNSSYRCQPSAGLMLFNVRGDSKADGKQSYNGWLIRIDQTGKLTCIHKSNQPVQGVRHLPGGNLLVTIIDGLVLEMTLAGEIVRQWYATGRYRD